MNENASDVIVIGAGLAGLAAARRVVAAGLAVRVLEARDRVGGRTWSRATVTGEMLDLGAQWIGPTQDRIAALARELGVRTFAQHHAGKKILSRGDRISTYARSIPSLPILGLLDLDRTITRVDAMSRSVPLDAPWSAARAREWDGVTVESWKRDHVHTNAARALVDIAVEAVFACEPSDLSCLFFLFYLRSAGGLMRLTEIPNGAQETRLVGGTQQLSIAMASALGARVALDAPARAIVQTEDGVVVRTGGTDAREHRAAHVIVAVPPALAGRIDYAPALPAARDQLTQRMPMGSVTKCIAVYAEPFWRRRGYSGEAVSDTGPVRLVFDDSPHDGSHGALVAFLLGRGAREWGGYATETRRPAVLAALARLFGEEAAHPLEYFDQDWASEPWSRGCYAALMPPGVLTAYGHALAAPVGRVHWAGTETARAWNGYMEGALESGERAADEVIARTTPRRAQ